VGRELPSHYDLVVNTDRFATEEAVKTIVQAATTADPRTVSA
jgi:cytidylate kinase